MSGFSVEGFYGRTNTSPDLPAGVDITDYGAKLSYDVSSQFVLGGNLMRTRISDGTNDVDLDMIGAAGAYDINDQWTAFGGVSRTSLDILSADVTTFGIGVSYDLTSLVNFGSMVSLEFARTDLDVGGPGGSLDTIRIGFTIPLSGKSGSGASRVPLNSVADAVLNPTHSVISSTILTAF